MRTARTFLVATALAVAVAGPARATERKLEFSPALDGTLIGVGVAGWVVPELFKADLAPDGCRWCHSLEGGGVDVNGFDRVGRGAFAGLFGVAPPTWARTTDVLAYMVLPLLAVAGDFALANGGRFDSALLVDVGVLAETVSLAATVNQAFKFSAGRQRPFVAYDSPWSGELRHANENAADDNLSFFSGHSTAALATTVGAARILELRTGKRLGYYTLVPLGVATALMRMSADKHWGSDVLMGMATGAAIGWLVPTLHAQ